MTCPDCNGDGVVVLECIVHACRCEAGEKNRFPLFAASDKKHENPIYLPVVGAQPKIVEPLRTWRDKVAKLDD